MEKNCINLRLLQDGYGVDMWLGNVFSLGFSRFLLRLIHLVISERCQHITRSSTWFYISLYIYQKRL